MDFFYAISDMGPLAIIGGVIVVFLFVKAITGKGNGGTSGKNSSSSSSSSSSASTEDKK